jgi:hypothetical protein
MRYLGEPNAVYLDGVGHDGDSRNAGSSDGLRVAGGMAEMKILDRIQQSDRPPNRKEKPESCYCSALPKGSPCLSCYTRWLAGGARKQSGLALPSFAGASK